MSEIKCHRCGGNPEDGACLDMQGEATGYNHERVILCARCLRAVRAFILDHPDKDAEVPDYRVIDKQRVAERFARKGLAQ